MSALVGELAGLSAAAAWAVGSSLFSRIGRDVSPLAMNLGKCLSAGTLLALTYVLVRGATVHAPAAALAWLAASALAGLTMGDTAYFSALVRLGVPRAILLLSTAPVFAALGAYAFLGEPLSARAAAGIAITLAGIAITVSASSRGQKVDPDAGNRARIAQGIGFGLLAGLGQAAGSLLSKRAMTIGLDPLFVSSGRLLFGGLSLVVTATASGRLGAVTGDLRRNRNWLRVVGAGIVGSYAGIWLSQIALAETPSAGVATTLLATSPVLALPIAHVLGDEKIGLRSGLGAVVTVLGVALLST